MSGWYLNQEVLEKIAQSVVRTDWANSLAYDHYFEIERVLEKELRNMSRLGALFIAEIQGLDGKQCWMMPIQGHKKLLSPNSEVKLLEKNATVFYSGLWKNVPETDILSREEFFIWLKPRNDERSDISISLKVKGFVRYLKHRIRSLGSK